MGKIEEYVEQSVEANLGSTMTGDHAVPPKIAISIALEAANRARQEATGVSFQAKRFELACQIFGPLAASPKGQGEYHTHTMPELCREALAAVDEIAKQVHASDIAVPSGNGAKKSKV